MWFRAVAGGRRPLMAAALEQGSGLLRARPGPVVSLAQFRIDLRVRRYRIILRLPGGAGAGGVMMVPLNS